MAPRMPARMKDLRRPERDETTTTDRLDALFLHPFWGAVCMAAIMLGVIAGADPDDPTASPHKVPDYAAGIGSGVRDRRIAIPRAIPGADDDVRRLERRRDHGVVDAHPHDASEDRPCCLAGAELHRLARHERRSDVRHVADAASELRRTIADQHAETDPETRKHDNRFDESRKDRAPPFATKDGDHVVRDVSPSRGVREVGANGGEQPA